MDSDVKLQLLFIIFSFSYFNLLLSDKTQIGQ